MLIRKHLTSGDIAYHHCYLPPGRTITLTTLIRVACLRWPVDDRDVAGEVAAPDVAAAGCSGGRTEQEAPRGRATGSWTAPRQQDGGPGPLTASGTPVGLAG